VDIRAALSDKSILKACDNLVNKQIKDPDRAQEIAQEIYLYMIEVYKPCVNWTRQKIIDTFSAKINKFNCRLKRLYEHDQQLDSETPANIVQTDVENLDLISKLPNNLQQTALLMYQKYTRAEVMTEQRISASMYYRRKLAIQEILL